MQISFIMVTPAYPSNVGATARALKAMGFERLVVTNPQADLSNERVRKLGKHADDIIDNIEVFPDLSAALQDVDISIAASHRIRHVNQASLTSRQLKQYIEDRGDMANHVAIVVGPESTGLRNEDVALCDAVVQIPCANEQPSLNLAQAVMILAYELSDLPLRISKKQQRKSSATLSELTYKDLKGQLDLLCRKLGIDQKGNLRERIIGRVDALSADDLRLVHRIRQAIENSISPRD